MTLDQAAAIIEGFGWSWQITANEPGRECHGTAWKNDGWDNPEIDRIVRKTAAEVAEALAEAVAKAEKPAGEESI